MKAGFRPSGHSAAWKRLDRYLGHPKPNKGYQRLQGRTFVKIKDCTNRVGTTVDDGTVQE